VIPRRLGGRLHPDTNDNAPPGWSGRRVGFGRRLAEGSAQRPKILAKKPVLGSLSCP